MQQGDSSDEPAEKDQLAVINRLWKERYNSLAANNKPILQMIFKHIHEPQKRRWLSTGELCPECFDYLYKRRALQQPKQSVFQITIEPVSLSGSLLDLLSRMPCPLCMAITHLMSSVDLSTLLQWSLHQTIADLQDTVFLASSDPHHEKRIRVQRKRTSVRNWNHVGFIEATALPEHAPLKLPFNTMQNHFREFCGLTGSKSDSASWFRSTPVDYELIRRWLRDCDRGHEQCRAQRAMSDKTAQIRLIDVTNKCIVQADLGAKYLALSYMWGGIERLSATAENIALLERPGGLSEPSLAESIPKVIKDAMDVVKNLGCQYLWVDAFCIVQNDQTEKHSQISMMDKIYAAAYATIVQHSGNSADAPLPGVAAGSRSSAAMTAPVRHTITGEALISMANCSVPEIFRTSPHSTRGWTLQEVLLSPRCLHFFDKHVTFLCNERFAQDWNKGGSSQVNFSSLTLLEMNPLKLNYRQMSNEIPEQDKSAPPNDGSLGGKINIEWLVFFEVYARVFTDYRSRNLTYDVDILHAFEGLGAQISRLNNGAMYYGLPSVSFDIALLWVCSRPSKRQHGTFPTWSPAAWIGAATYNICNVTGAPSQPFRHCSFVRDYRIVEKGKSITVNRSNAFQSGPSEYLRMRQTLSEPHVEEKSIWPNGCLHFWAELAAFGQLKVYFKDDKEHLYLRINEPHTTLNDEIDVNSHTRRTRASSLTEAQENEEKNNFTIIKGKPRGIVFLSAESYQKLVQDVIPDCWLVLLSESRIFDSVRARPGEIRLGNRTESRLVFNFLLVQREKEYVNRLAFGQILPHDWLSLKRRREYVKII